MLAEQEHGAEMKGGYIDGKLECKTCGTITLIIPKDANEFTPISCSNCGETIGLWGDLQDDFAKQSRDVGVLELTDGRIRKTRAAKRPVKSTD